MEEELVLPVVAAELEEAVELVEALELLVVAVLPFVEAVNCSVLGVAELDEDLAWLLLLLAVELVLPVLDVCVPVG